MALETLSGQPDQRLFTTDTRIARVAQFHLPDWREMVPLIDQSDPLVRDAVELAVAAHTGPTARHNGVRKGTLVPYVSHALETGILIQMFRQEASVVAAGLLHDVPSVTGITIDEIKERFPPNESLVALIVDQLTNNETSKPWEERQKLSILRATKLHTYSLMVENPNETINMLDTMRQFGENGGREGDSMFKRFSSHDRLSHFLALDEKVEALHKTWENNPFDNVMMSVHSEFKSMLLKAR